MPALFDGVPPPVASVDEAVAAVAAFGLRYPVTVRADSGHDEMVNDVGQLREAVGAALLHARTVSLEGS